MNNYKKVINDFINLFQLGISLSIDQFKELVKVIPHLESEIA